MNGRNKNDIVSRIPKKEHKVWHKMRRLEQGDKRLLWQFIQESNKENVIIYEGKHSQLTNLLNERLIVKNPIYQPRKKELSLFILPEAPYLIRILNREYN